MSKVSAVELRVGNLLEWDKRVWRVIKCYHVHVGGRGGAFMQVEMKDIEAGTKTNQRFRTEDKVERAFVDPREMTFSYQDGDNYVFMMNGLVPQGSSGYLYTVSDLTWQVGGVGDYDGDGKADILWTNPSTPFTPNFVWSMNGASVQNGACGGLGCAGNYLPNPPPGWVVIDK